MFTLIDCRNMAERIVLCTSKLSDITDWLNLDYQEYNNVEDINTKLDLIHAGMYVESTAA